MTEINFELLRKMIMDYYGSAANSVPAAMESVIEAESASNDRLIKMAKTIGIIED